MWAYAVVPVGAGLEEKWLLDVVDIAGELV